MSGKLPRGVVRAMYALEMIVVKISMLSGLMNRTKKFVIGNGRAIVFYSPIEFILSYMI